MVEGIEFIINKYPLGLIIAQVENVKYFSLLRLD